MQNSTSTTNTMFKGEMSMETKNHAEDQVQAKLRGGKTLVIAGTMIAIAGIIIYCGDSFSAGPDQQDAPMMTAGLGVIGFGSLLWLVGAVKYLKTAIDHDIPDSSF